MKISKVICLLLLLSIVSYGQVQENVFGKVYLKDFRKPYKPEYPASVIFDRGTSIFRNEQGIYIEYARETRIHVHKKEGASYAEITIPYYQDGYGKEETIVSIEGSSYNLDDEEGTVEHLRLKTAMIYDDQISDRWKVKKFVLPAVKEGTIIEYRYVKRSPFIKNPPDWEFQWGIPVKLSMYEMQLMPFYEYTYLLQGAARFDDYYSFESGETDDFGGVRYNYVVHRYVMKELPPFEDESFITSRNDFIVKLDFQLARIHYPSGAKKEIMSSWPEINALYLDDNYFGRFLKQCAKPAQVLLSSRKNLKNSDNPVKSIVEFVRSEFNWNGHVRDVAVDKAKEFIENGNGGSAEINLFLCAMLNEVGLEAKPVLVSTRDHGKIHREYPFEHYFNDVVVLVNTGNEELLVDGTNPLLAYDRIPMRCLNDKGLVVDEEEVRWVSLESDRPSIESYYVDMKIEPADKTIQIRSMNRLKGYSGYAARRTIGNDSEKLRLSRLSLDIEDLSNIEIQNVENPDYPFTITFSGQRPIESYGNKILIQPMAGIFEKENIFRAESRKYPVDMIYPKIIKGISLVHIPDGYYAIELPQNFSLNNELMEGGIQIHQDKNQIRITTTLSFKSAVYLPSVYQQLRSNYSEVLSKFNQMIVLSADVNAQR